MQIIGFNFNKISAERVGKSSNKLNIAMSINLSNLEKEDTKTLNKDVLRADFDFSISYEKLAKFEIKGSTFFIETPEKIKEIMKKWDKDKRFLEDIRVPLLNFILNKCNVRALQLEEEFNLPPHIQLPKVSNTSDEKKDDKTKYV